MRELHTWSAVDDECEAETTGEARTKEVIFEAEA